MRQTTWSLKFDDRKTKELFRRYSTFKGMKSVVSSGRRYYKPNSWKKTLRVSCSSQRTERKTLPVRKCGNQGFKCAVQGLGCVGMSAYYKGYETSEAQAEAMRVFDRAAQFEDLMLDTSDSYGPYTNEQLIREILSSRLTTTKRCFVADRATIGNHSEFVIRVHKEELSRSACEEMFTAGVDVRFFAGSLERLGVDCIDLYYLHRYDRKTPIKETMGAFKELIDEGKIEYVGMSEVSIATLRKAHVVCPITAYEMEWSLITRDVEVDLVPTCRELGIGIVTYSPLGRGFLTGAIKSKEDIPKGDWREKHPRLNEHFDHNVELVKIVEEVAAEKGCTPGQVALAWVHAQGEDVFPIPGTKHVDRFEENVAAFDVKLTGNDMTKLNGIADQMKGSRLPVERMSMVYNSP